MKTPIFILLILILDCLALHDIFKGNEPNLKEEYTVILASIIIFMIVLYRHIHIKKLKY